MAKQRVTTILVGGTVLTMNTALDRFADGTVAILNDSIVAIGPSPDILASYEADEVIDCDDM